METSTQPDPAVAHYALVQLFGSVFDVLVREAGAMPTMRHAFICANMGIPHDTPCDEWRFQGSLGFGGKYWRKENRVTCYPEDETQERLETITATNAALSMLNARAVTPGANE